MNDDTGDEASVRAWLSGWGRLVAAVEPDEAAELFDPDVVGFGTRAAIARGRDALVATQWRHVWPNIGGFAFDADGAEVWVSPDRLLAVIAAEWTSHVRDAGRNRSPRPGRATVTLRRTTHDDPWLGVHTHFSLVPTDPGTDVG